MPIEKAEIGQFMELAKDFPVFDVRSPGEFLHAHIPGAHNLPLFTDEERKVVGTAYKQQGRERAIKIGLDYFGPRMSAMVKEVESIAGTVEPGKPKPTVLVHCWRGGMRSAGVAWLLDLYGFAVYTLIGGYKRYRHWILDAFDLPVQIQILGGYTGSGKTQLLEELERRGSLVVNLEKLAVHKGSAFGHLGLPPQPSQEMFENRVGQQIRSYSSPGRNNNSSGSLQDALNGNSLHPVMLWMEDESQRIGHVNLPPSLWNRMLHSPIFFLELPFEERLQRIKEEYGNLDKTRMGDAILRIRKRLGPLDTKLALQELEKGDVEACFRILLRYYDRMYDKAMEIQGKNKYVQRRVAFESIDIPLMADHIKNLEPADYD